MGELPDNKLLVWNVVAFLVSAGLFFGSYILMRQRKAKDKRVALVMFAGLPLFIWMLASVAWLSNKPVAVVRVAFIYTVVVLPPSLFFLFIATRRESLFNHYATNLDRLGLLRKRQLRVVNAGTTHYPVEDDLRLTRRVKGYLNRFSAVYGFLPDGTVNEFLSSVVGQNTVPVTKAGTDTGDLFASFDVKTVLPVFGAGALIALGWLMVLPPYPAVQPSSSLALLEDTYKLNGWYLWAAEPVLLPATFAFLGAYFFSLQMLVKRFMRRDLGPNAYNAVSMRIILATLGVWVAVQCFESTGGKMNHGTLLMASFAVGAFPLIVWQLLANLLKKIPGALIVLPNLQGTRPLSHIDGLSVWHEARLEEEDVENVPNLATADIVDLMLNTKISPNRIIDWVDQAILLVLLPPRTERADNTSLDAVLTDYGIRTASALVAATKSPDGQEPVVIDNLSGTMKQQALALAAAVQLCPNYPLVQNWLATEPYFPPDAKQEGIPDDVRVAAE
jgi:hypothetical protein